MNKIKILIIFVAIVNFIFVTPTLAATPTPTISTTITPAPSLTTPVDEKVNEIRQAIKDKLVEIKNKVEKRAYVGPITEVTDSVVTINNFRGKQRVRLNDDTLIIDQNKKEIKKNDLEIDKKIIAMGDLSENDILDAKRIVVVAPPKTQPGQKMVVFGPITAIDLKNSTLTISSNINKDNDIIVKIDNQSYLFSASDQKTLVKLKNLKENQKIIAVYYQTAEGKTPLVKTIFAY